MSWWDKYLAPGDLRQQRQALSSPSQPGTANEDEQPRLVVLKPPRLSQADRVRRQNGLLFGGLAFTLLSMIVTRRAVGRKLAQTALSAEGGAAAAESKVDGSLEAVQALGYATLNVFSVAMLGIGGAMKYFDIADVEDMREVVRRQEGYSEDSEANREIEGWIAEVLARKDGQGNLRESVVEKVAEIERKRKEDEKRGR
ncbi:hypothetical protein BDY17DRAFT_252855 [Neohortaea acidophila]|uniref:Altered inheritance of mitochondria protein 11 n=1 Tax=Neohortaea acidophila TaxID=245834 RepID=A0A6A6PR14_9PEZI|nr:uncharacterized protein BDY17DRAFT_252855 [Neohortaea acidophila]KAF2482141.1 hypothetical protein BDY17DRAFT_252855 [Neohortaea acidophila]